MIAKHSRRAASAAGLSVLAVAGCLAAGDANAGAKRTQLGSLLEVSQDTTCDPGVTCTLKFGFENADYLITNLSCHLLFDLNGPQPMTYQLATAPASTVEYLYNPGATGSGSTGKADALINQPMMHILPKGSNPVVTVTFDFPPTNAAIGCTWAGTQRP